MIWNEKIIIAIALQRNIRIREENQLEMKQRKFVVYDDDLLGYNTNIFTVYCEYHMKDTSCR